MQQQHHRVWGIVVLLNLIITFELVRCGVITDPQRICNRAVLGRQRCCRECQVMPTSLALCVAEERPVCGCNGQTYQNVCLLQNDGITRWSPGACEDKSRVSCVVPSNANPSAQCREILFRPVCGCDGVTYDGACTASAAGLSDWVVGKCRNANQGRASVCDIHSECCSSRCLNVSKEEPCTSPIGTSC